MVLSAASRSQSLAIGTKGDAIDPIAMPGEGSDGFLGLQVPQFDGLSLLAEAKVKPSGLHATLLTP
jgi:hypothetical protein